MATYRVKSKVVPYPGMAAWYFAYLEKSLADRIRNTHARNRAGFGSIRVTVKLGSSIWKTSIFPDSHSGSYVLPIKKAIRKAEGIDAGDTVSFTLTIPESRSTTRRTKS